MHRNLQIYGTESEEAKEIIITQSVVVEVIRFDWIQTRTAKGYFTLFTTTQIEKQMDKVP